MVKERPPKQKTSSVPATVISGSEPAPKSSVPATALSGEEPTLPATEAGPEHGPNVPATVVNQQGAGEDDLLTPEHAGRYVYREALGAGGIGKVQVMRDRHLGRDVACKELHSRFTVRDEGGERTPLEVRFLGEARVTGRLEHPGIVPVYELGRRDDGTVYYTMKVVHGRTMAEALEGQDLAGRLGLLPHFLELCHAVAYAHSRQVIHRDLKPDNVMLGDFGETIVLDWGLAKLRGGQEPGQGEVEDAEDAQEELRRASDSATVAGSPMGTPSYMPPEQADGDLEAIDERSDVYSLGAILYQLLTGKAPYSGASALEVINRVRSLPARPPAELEPRCPAELADIATRAMSRDRQRRYADAGELAADVLAFQTGELVGAHTYTLGALLARWVRRHRKALAAVAVVLVAGAGAWWYRGHAERARQQEAEQQRQASVRVEVNRMLAAAARGKVARQWFDTHTFKLISMKEPLVEDRLVVALDHGNADIRRLAARCLGGMKSRRALTALTRRLAPGVESSEEVLVEVINALGIIGDGRAEQAVAAARRRLGQHGSVWRRTELAYRMIPLPPLKPGMTSQQWHVRGRALENKGNKKGAMAAYDRAVALDSQAWRSFNNRGTVHRRLGNFKEAMADYDQAIRINPEDMAALHNRAMLKNALGDRKGALADLDTVVSSGKVGGLALRNRALLRNRMSDRKGALEDLRRAVRLRPESPSNHHYTGKLWCDEEQWDRALAAFDRALALNTRYVGALIWRAYVHQMKSNLRGALRDLDRVLLLQPSNASARRQRANVRLLLGDAGGAREDLDLNIKARPREAYRWAMRGAVLYAQRGDFARALADFKEALTRATRTNRMLLSVCALALALRVEDAATRRDLLAKIPKIVEPRKWYAGLGRAVTNRAPAADLAATAGKHQVRRCHAHLAAGIRAALASDHNGARVEYARAGNVPRPNDLPCVLARALGK